MSEQPSMNQIPTVKHKDRIELAKLFIAAEIGAIITYDDMRAVMIRDPQSNGRNSVIGATTDANASTGKLYVNIRGVGVQCVSANQAPGIGQSVLDSCRRKTSKAMKKIANAVNKMGQSLSESERIAVSTTQAMLGAMHLFGKKDSRKRIEAEVQKRAGEKMEIGETVKFFENKK